MTSKKLPKKNDIVTIIDRTHFTRLKSDCEDVETSIMYPVLQGPECTPFGIGDKVRVVKVVVFDGGWKALVKNDEDGRMIYLHDYQVKDDY